MAKYEDITVRGLTLEQGSWIKKEAARMGLNGAGIIKILIQREVDKKKELFKPKINVIE